MATTHDELAELRAAQVRPPRQITTRERIAQLEAAERRERGLAIARRRVPGYDGLLEAARAAEAAAWSAYERLFALRHERSQAGVDRAKKNLAKAGPFARFRPAAGSDDDTFDNATVGYEPVPFGGLELVRESLEEKAAENTWRVARAERERLERLPLQLWQAEDATASFDRAETMRQARLTRRGIPAADVDQDRDQKAQRRRRATSAA